MPAFPGFWAFPGGGLSRVDSQSIDELEQLNGEHAKAVAAMSREMVEELGYAWNGNNMVAVDDDYRKCSNQRQNKLATVSKRWQKFSCSMDGIKVISRRITPPFAPVDFDNVLHLHAGNKGLGRDKFRRSDRIC